MQPRTTALSDQPPLMQQCWLFFVGTTTPGGDLSNGKIAGIVVGVVVWLYYLVLGVAFMIAGLTIRSASVNVARIWVWTT
jgi:hypothetical protein